MRVFFSLFHMCILSIKYESLTNMNLFEVAGVPCYAMLCSVVVRCGLVRCKVLSCGVVCRGVL